MRGVGKEGALKGGGGGINETTSLMARKIIT